MFAPQAVSAGVISRWPQTPEEILLQGSFVGQPPSPRGLNPSCSSGSVIDDRLISEAGADVAVVFEKGISGRTVLKLRTFMLAKIGDPLIGAFLYPIVKPFLLGGFTLTGFRHRRDVRSAALDNPHVQSALIFYYTNPNGDVWITRRVRTKREDTPQIAHQQADTGDKTILVTILDMARRHISAWPDSHACVSELDKVVPQRDRDIELLELCRRFPNYAAARENRLRWLPLINPRDSICCPNTIYPDADCMEGMVDVWD
jgi:hypothetical protein